MIYERLRNVHLLGGCAVITGDAGIDKTKTIQKYANDNTSTIVITADVFNHTANDMLCLIGEQLGINKTSPRCIKNAVFAKLHSNMLLIVDEAQELNYKAANALCSIPDKFERQRKIMGLAFVGNPCFYDMFDGRYADDRVQVSSRFVTEQNLKANQILFDDTKLLYPPLTQQNMIKELMFLYIIATNPSLGQRKALYIFKNAYNCGKYDLDTLAEETKKARLHFENLNKILEELKK